MSIAPPRRLHLFLALAAVYLIWGSTYLAIRFAIETLPPFAMAAVRFLVAGSILFAYSLARGEKNPSRGAWGSALVVGILLLVGGNGGVVWAEQRIDSGIAALLVTTMPFFLVLVTALLPGGRPPTARMLVGLLVGFAGVVVLLNPFAHGHLAVDPIGAAVVTLSAISWATGSALAGRLPLPKSPPLSTGIQMLAGGAVLALVSIATGEPSHFHRAEVSLRSILALAYLVVFGAVVAYTAFVWLLKHAPPALVATYAYVNPLVAVLLGWALAGEELSSRVLLAAGIIVAGVMIISRSGEARAEAKSVPIEQPLATPAPLTKGDVSS